MKKISVSGGIGQDAGSINISLTEHSNLVVYNGSHQGSVAKNDTLALLARGGDGQNGRIGADGHDGLPGMAGFPATPFTYGTNGSPGGHGGDGEMGTDGMPAHPGGHIEVSVDEKDLALLPIIEKVDVSAGNPGAPGRHGRGGRGGPGGMGGAPYTWQTSYEVRRPGPRNQHGHPSADIVEIHYRTHFHPGGIQGADGLPGRTYQHALKAGAQAPHGRYQINVMKEGKVISTHHSSFGLEIETPETLASLCYEPGETVTLPYGLKNNGHTLQSPAEAIPLILNPNSSLEDVKEAEVEGDIKPNGMKKAQKKPLQFKIKSIQQDAKETPYEKEVKLCVYAKNTRLQSSYTSRVDTLKVKYPVELEPQETHLAIGLGETKELSLAIRNQSLKHLGSDASRKVRVEIAPKAKGAPSISESIKSLKPGSRTALKHEVGFSEGAKFGSQLQYDMNLYLQPIDTNQEETLIQRIPVSFQLTPTYKPGKSGFLLVINSETTPEALEYWVERLGKIAGEDISIWNTSYYGSFELDGESSLLSNHQHGTVVILDNQFSKDNLKNSQYITQQQLLKAGLEHDVSLMVVGEGSVIPKATYKGEGLTDEYLDKAISYSSIDSLMKDLMKEEEKDSKHRAVQMSYYSNKFFRTYMNCSEETEKFRQLLAKTFPNRRYYVRDIARDDSCWELFIERLPDFQASEIKTLRLNDEEMKHPKAQDPSHLKGVISAMPFTQKLRLFAEASNSYHKELAIAMTEDILAESNLVFQSKRYGTWWDILRGRYHHDFNLELKKLSALVHQVEKLPLQQATLWTPHIVKLIAQVSHHARAHSSFWTRLANWFIRQNNEEVKKVSNAMCQQALKAHSMHLGKSLEDLNKAVLNENKKIEFGLSLQAFIQKHQSSSESCFFSLKKLSSDELKAANSLLALSRDEVSEFNLNEAIFQSPLLKPWTDKFKNLTAMETLLVQRDHKL